MFFNRHLLVNIIFGYLALIAFVSCIEDELLKKVCHSMTNPPRNLSTVAQSTRPPYVIWVNAKSVLSLHNQRNNFTHQQSGMHHFVNLTLSSPGENVTFNGFLLVAETHNALLPRVIGSFSLIDIDGSQTLSCFGRTNNAVMHTNALPKLRESFLWTPPANYSGQITFKATVVMNYLTYWIGVESAPVNVIPDVETKRFLKNETTFV